MDTKLYKVFKGNEVFTLTEGKSEPIVEGMLMEEDYVLLVAEEKIGKTILAQQLACNLTSATPFLGIFDIPKAVRVWYFATEGKVEDLKDRFIRMRKAVKVDEELLTLFATSFRFNTKEGLASLEEILITNQDKLPKVIIIDAMYRAVKGSIKNDDVVNEFHHVVGLISRTCDCSVIVVHHMTKPQRNQSGDFMDRSDKDTYGSAFLLAGVDHCLRLEKWHKDKDCPNDRFLRCDTQRSGDMVGDIRIRLIQPDPLYFEIVSKHIEEKHMVIQLLKSHREGYDVNTLGVKISRSRSIVYAIIRELLNEGVIRRYGGKRKFYALNN